MRSASWPSPVTTSTGNVAPRGTFADPADDLETLDVRQPVVEHDGRDRRMVRLE